MLSLAAWLWVCYSSFKWLKNFSFSIQRNNRKFQCAHVLIMSCGPSSFEWGKLQSCVGVKQQDQKASNTAIFSNNFGRQASETPLASWSLAFFHSGLVQCPLCLNPTNTHTEGVILTERRKIIMTWNQKQRKHLFPHAYLWRVSLEVV